MEYEQIGLLESLVQLLGCFLPLNILGHGLDNWTQLRWRSRRKYFHELMGANPRISRVMAQITTGSFSEISA